MTRQITPFWVMAFIIPVLIFNPGCGKEKAKEKPYFTPKHSIYYLCTPIICGHDLYLSIPEKKKTWDFKAEKSGFWRWTLDVNEKLMLTTGSIQLVLSSDGPKTIIADVGFLRNGKRLYTADAEFLIDSETPQALEEELLVHYFDLQPGDRIDIYLRYERDESSAKLFNFSGSDASFIRLESEKID